MHGECLEGSIASQSESKIYRVPPGVVGQVQVQEPPPPPFYKIHNTKYRRSLRVTCYRPSCFSHPQFKFSHLIVSYPRDTCVGVVYVTAGAWSFSLSLALNCHAVYIALSAGCRSGLIKSSFRFMSAKSLTQITSVSAGCWPWNFLYRYV